MPSKRPKTAKPKCHPWRPPFKVGRVIGTQDRFVVDSHGLSIDTKYFGDAILVRDALNATYPAAKGRKK